MGIRKYNTEEERKAAKREYDAKRYQEKRDKILAQQAERYKQNKDKILVQQAERYKQNKDKILARQTAYNATPFGRATYLVGGYRKADKKYNRGECTIDAQWIVDSIFTQPCHYCGESDWHKLGVDRKDSSLPHTPENCVPCCKTCNEKKGTTFYDDFMRRIGKIA